MAAVGCRSASRVLLALLFLLLAPIISSAEMILEDDPWLANVIGPERLVLGDEFGCHGIPNKDVRNDFTVIDECKHYLNSQTSASRWGVTPLSFGISGADVGVDLQMALHNSGFRVVGGHELTGEIQSLWSFVRSGGSLEKNIASIDLIEAEVQDHSYANMYWQAEIESLNVRQDKDVLSWIESEPFWFTTWGEYFSSMHQAEVVQSDLNALILRGSEPSDGGWNVPGTTHLSVSGCNITEVVRIDGIPFPEFTEKSRHLEVGYRIQDSRNALLTIPMGVDVRITFDQDASSFSVKNSTFNGLTPFMVMGYHTTDLFEWSSPFQDSPLRFTWLIEPRIGDATTPFLPILATTILLGTLSGFAVLIRRDRSVQLERRMESE